MATMKKRALTLSSGKSIKMNGNSISITASLEVGEGFTTNVFGLLETSDGERNKPLLSNPFALTVEEIIEIADYNMRLWMDLKEAVREKGVSDTSVFRKVTP